MTSINWKQVSTPLCSVKRAMLQRFPTKQYKLLSSRWQCKTSRTTLTLKLLFKKLQAAAYLSQTLSFNSHCYKNFEIFLKCLSVLCIFHFLVANSDYTDKCTIARALTVKFHLMLSTEVELHARFQIFHLFLSFLGGNHSTEWSLWLTATTVGILFRAGGAWNPTIVLQVQLVLLEESRGKCFLFKNLSLQRFSYMNIQLHL